MDADCIQTMEVHLSGHQNPMEDSAESNASDSRILAVRLIAERLWHQLPMLNQIGTYREEAGTYLNTSAVKGWSVRAAASNGPDAEGTLPSGGRCR